MLVVAVRQLRRFRRNGDEVYAMQANEEKLAA
jgi:hypothetical protein